MKKFYSLFAITALALFSTAEAHNLNPRFAMRTASNSMAKAAETNEYGKLITVTSEDFSKFTNGSITSPASDEIETDWSGNFDESKLTSPGWGGKYVHEAGGSAFVEKPGFITSPSNLDFTSAVDQRFYVHFKARLAQGETEGTPSVTMGYGTPKTAKPLSPEWQDYTIEFSGDYSGTYLTFKATCDWLIDDIKIVKVMPFIDAPEQITFTHFTGTGFRAVWFPVEDAVSYTVDVYSVDSEENYTEVVTGLKSDDTFLDVADLPVIDDLFCFTVKAVDAAGHVSKPSYTLLVEGLLTPNTYDAINVSANNFTASWDGIPGAMAYDVYAYRETTVKSDATVDIVNTGFDFVNSSMTTELISTSFDLFPGWIINLPLFEDGSIGMDGGIAPTTTMYASMESPGYDLSNGDGTIEVTLSARSTRGARMTVSLFTMKNGVYSVYPEDYAEITNLPFEQFETRKFTLKGGGKTSVIYIQTDDFGQVWLDDLHITQNIKAGQTAKTPVFNIVTEDNEAVINNVDLTDGNKYYYTLRAMGISRDESYEIASDFTEPHYVSLNSTGIDENIAAQTTVKTDGQYIIITNPEASPVNVFDISGRNVFNDNSGLTGRIRLSHGLYITRIGDRTFKVSL